MDQSVEKLADIAKRLSPVLVGLKKYEANFDGKAKQTLQARDDKWLIWIVFLTTQLGRAGWNRHGRENDHADVRLED